MVLLMVSIFTVLFTLDSIHTTHQPDATPSRPHAATLYATQNENMLWTFAYD